MLAPYGSNEGARFPSMQQLVILGAGAHAREQLDLIAALNAENEQYRVLGFLVDPEFDNSGDRIADIPVLGDCAWLEGRTEQVQVICAVGSSSLRRKLVGRAAAFGAQFPVLVHPHASIGSRVELGPGSIISAGAVLTCDLSIGAHVHVNVGSSVSHDCQLGDFVTLAPGAHLAGVVSVGSDVEIGVGAVISDRVAVGSGAVLGAGTVAISDVPAHCTVVGVPARVISSRGSG